ncbi:MAG: ABC transporter ATP-binding protein/permease [Bacillota bacterium]|nr:ABC transporter ATP-binding protein/permease [Bacillota bacterium]
MSENRRKMNQGPMDGRRGGGPMGGMGRPVEKAKDFKGTFKRLLRYLRPHKINLLIVLIFAILSTLFTIAAPKIASKAMNKLQNSYMASKMLSEMAKGQNTAVDQMKDKMGDVQKEVVDKINDQMADGQKKAVDQITTSMGDAQGKAVNEMYKSIAIQLHNGDLTGQKTAVDNITTQMGTVQKSLVTQMQQQMQQMQTAQQQGISVPPMDAKTLAAIQKLMKLPMISSITDRQSRINTTLQFIDILQSLPPNGQMDTSSLTSVKEILSIPLLYTVKNPYEKITVIKKFMSLAKSMPGGSGSQSSMQLDTKTMNKALAKIPEIKSFSTASSSSSASKMDKKAMDSVQKLLKLPMLKDIKDAKEKRSTLIQLIDIFKNMPDMSMGSTKAASGSTMNKADLQTILDLLAVPDISSIKDSKEKSAAVIKLVDIFGKMPDMNKSGSDSKSSEMMSSDQLKSVKDLLKLPMLNSITDPAEKTKVLNQMLDVFGKMPDMGTSDTSSENKMDTKSIKSVQEFLALPKLDTLTDPSEKAEVCRKIMDLGTEMQSAMKDAPTNPKGNIKYTDAQIDSVITAIKETNGKYDFHYIGVIALILIGMYIISALFSLTMGLVMSGVSQKTVRDLRREVDEKLARLPLKYYDLHSHGDILSRVTNDVDTIATTLQQSLTQIITSVITIIGYIIMMLTISPVLTLIVIATMPLYIISISIIAKKSQKFFAVQQKEIGLLSGHVEEMYTGHKIVKAFGHEKDSIEEFEAINSRLKDAGWKAQFVSGIMYPLMNFISNLGYVGISIVGGLWITKSLLGLGDILAFIQYSRSFTMPIVQTANIANVIQSTIACAERVFQILDEEEELADSEDAVVIESPRGDVTFEHVDFRYTEDVPLIENMNIDVKQGHTIAIVGPTGAGKTTLVNLLMRFYEINAGKISIDGININDIKRSELRRMFGMVLQDTWLYNGTIRDNIAYSKEGATMEEVRLAAKAAHADHFIRTLPQGYDTVLNEEATNISQGQKQLLTIARAILADPAILILDEATSSVDTRTEVLIQKAMANLMNGRTSFVIAHRLSTIRDAELILVMNKGSIIEMGNHKELLSQGGFYADLYNSQFTGANLEGDAV